MSRTIVVTVELPKALILLYTWYLYCCDVSVYSNTGGFLQSNLAQPSMSVSYEQGEVSPGHSGHSGPWYSGQYNAGDTQYNK